MPLRYNGNLIENAKALRKNGTKQEKHLWYDFLCKYPVRFQRQKTIGSYIVDFYCCKAQLVIELDGSQHYEPEGMEKDRARDEKLRALGYEVVRYSNTDVHSNLEGVAEDILSRLEKQEEKTISQ